MEKKPRKQKRDYDFAVNAFRVVQEATQDALEPQVAKQAPIEGKNPAAVALGRLGGLKGGKARTSKLTPGQRTELARLAANARWKKSS
jgi:hypothetical protein